MMIGLEAEASSLSLVLYSQKKVLFRPRASPGKDLILFISITPEHASKDADSSVAPRDTMQLGKGGVLCVLS